MEPSTELPPRWERGGQLRGRRWRWGLGRAACGEGGLRLPRRRRTPGSWPGACCPASVDIISKRGRGPGLSNSRAALQQTHTEPGFRACAPLRGGGDLLLRKQQPRVGSSPDKSHQFRSAAPSPLSPRARDSRAETTPAAGWRPLQALPRLPPRRPGSPVSCAQGPTPAQAPSVLLSPSLETREGVQPAPSYSHRVCGFSPVLFTWVL